MTILLAIECAETLKALSDSVIRLHHDATVLPFSDGLAALGAARQQEIDVALLSPTLPDLEGLDLGRYLCDLNPLVNLIFVASDGRFGSDALMLHASGYLITPVADAALIREFEDLRHPAAQKNHKRVFAQTFGNFDLFVDGKPVAFKYTKTKEIVALLVNNRGAMTTNGEIIASLWEDDGDPEKKASYLSNLRQDLTNTFARLKISNLLLKQRGALAIAADRIECDVYDWLKNKQKSKYNYLGDYMNQYSWAEYIHAELDEISYAMDD